MNQSIQWLNELTEAAAKSEFLKCCGSLKWAEAMAASRPFANSNQMFANAEAFFGEMTESDWLEAFRAHPKIGEKKAASTQSKQAQDWSAQEQSGTEAASQRTADELAEKNREYESRFDFIFIVCATGKSAAEMLVILNDRLDNDRATELRIAAGEQAKITMLRLEKLLNR
jgi:2-oxo-4-hydroxy-4-carboxy-5-ureidoimidazoline decarboxylase